MEKINEKALHILSILVEETMCADDLNETLQMMHPVQDKMILKETVLTFVPENRYTNFIRRLPAKQIRLIMEEINKDLQADIELTSMINSNHE